MVTQSRGSKMKFKTLFAALLLVLTFVACSTSDHKASPPAPAQKSNDQILCESGGHGTYNTSTLACSCVSGYQIDPTSHTCAALAAGSTDQASMCASTGGTWDGTAFR